MKRALTLLLALAIGTCQLHAAPSQVDVLIVGGTISGVSAAIAAKQAGASVYLIAQRPYLGDDKAGKLSIDASDAPTDAYPSPLTRAFAAPERTKGATLFGTTTPIAIKRVLDEALASNAIPFRTWTPGFQARLALDGQLAGVDIYDRTGRTFIRAKVIVDATERAQIARSAGLPFRPFPSGIYHCTRYIISGNAPTLPTVTATPISTVQTITLDKRGPHQAQTQPREIHARLWKCEFDLPLDNGTARTLAAAEQNARDLTWTAQQLDAADTITFLPPDTLQSRLQHPLLAPSPTCDWASACRAPAIDNLLVAGPLTDISRETLAQQGNYRSCLAELIGTQAGKVAARLASTRSLATPLPTPKQPQTIAHCQTVVAGLGTSGAASAIAAARYGARTIGIDYLWRAGGVMTDGLIGLYCYGFRQGFTAELDQGVRYFGAVYGQAKAEWLRLQAKEAGAELWFGSTVCGVEVNSKKSIQAVLVAMADGSVGRIETLSAIDATGNADLAAFGGEETEFITPDELSLQGAGSTPKILGASYQNTDYAFVNDCDAEDLCHFTLRARNSFGPYVWDQSQCVNSRERRRLMGVQYITAQDIVNNRTYPDTISLARSNFDTHGQTCSDQFFIEPPHAAKTLEVNIPYRALLPKRVDGLLVTGLGMSAHRDAMPVLRMQPDLQNQGYAAGLAAAMSIASGKRLRDVDMPALQRQLCALGIIPREAIGAKDNFPLPPEAIAEAVGTLRTNYTGLAKVLSDVPRSLPLLKQAFARCEKENERLIYAHVLGLLRQPEAAPTLIAKLAATPSWDKGWNYKGMDQFGRSVSWVDSWIIALGRTQSVLAIPQLDRLASLLTGEDAYSHFRALALAYESIGEKCGTEPLARLLRLPKVGGHALKPNAAPKVKGYDVFADFNLGLGDQERSDCLRELCLARALFNLGDKEHLGRRTLEAYARDPRRAYARHAQLILAGR